MRILPLLSLLGCFGLAVCSTAQALAEPAQTKTPAIPETPAEKEGLRVSISPTYLNEERVIELLPSSPHINVVLQNTSSKPINIFEEWNSSGYGNLTLKITEVDGKALEKPLTASKGMMAWSIDSTSSETLAPGEARVREVRLQIPVRILYPTSPITGSLNPVGPFYGEFPVPLKNGSRQITMSAVFSNDEPSSETRMQKQVVVWTGQIASPPTDYRVYWGSDTR